VYVCPSFAAAIMPRLDHGAGRADLRDAAAGVGPGDLVGHVDGLEGLAPRAPRVHRGPHRLDQASDRALAQQPLLVRGGDRHPRRAGCEGILDLDGAFRGGNCVIREHARAAGRARIATFDRALLKEDLFASP
jgi:hypothetical protein